MRSVLLTFLVLMPGIAAAQIPVLHAAADAAWLRLMPSDGVSPGVLRLDVATQGLAVGSCAATVTGTMAGAPNRPARIPVQLVVRK